MMPSSPYSAGAGLHRFAVLLACAVVGLIAAGANVTSKDAGLSVPDWPTSYGGINPPRWYEIETVRAEHGHRLYAGTVAIATLGLAIALQRREPRRWVRRLGWTAVAAVLAQAVLGGITVLFFLPTAVSVAHAGLAQLFLCLTVLLALATSSAWRSPAAAEPAIVPVAGAAAVATSAIYAQILLGAVMRHLGAGLAIPDFPLVFGGLWPTHWSAGIAAHYAHRVGALIVTALVVHAVVRIFRAREAASFLRLPALAWVVVLGGQVTLGSVVVLSQRAVVPNTAHVATGALLLALGWVVTLGAWRLRRAVKAEAALESPAAVREAVA